MIRDLGPPWWRQGRSVGGLWVPSHPTGHASSRTRSVGIDMFVPHEAVFPDLPGDFAEFKRLLRTLSRTDTILWCARLNLLVSRSTDANPKGIQAACVQVFFDRETGVRLNAFTSKHGGRDGVSVFFRGQLLELIRWAALLCPDRLDDGASFEVAATRLTFVRVALLASELWSRRLNRQLGSDGPLDEVRRKFLPSARRQSIENAWCPHPFLAIARGSSLFADRLNAAKPEFGPLFQKVTGVSIDDYVAFTAHIATETLEKDVRRMLAPDTSGLFNVGANEAASGRLGIVAREYFRREAQTADELRQGFWGDRTDASEEDAQEVDIGAIRLRPIFRTLDGRGIVLDQRSFVERVSAGPLFEMTRFDRKNGLDWFSAFGEVFQDYAQDIFRRIFPEKIGLARRFTAEPTASDSKGRVEPLGDGVVVAPRTLILVEIKGVWLPDTITAPDTTASDYLAQIRRRYGVVDDPLRGERKTKGVGQLARSILRLGLQTWIPQDFNLADFDRIVPVLVVHDPHVDAPLHSQMMAREFTEALGAIDSLADWSEPTVGRLRIAHLVVVTIDDLEALETSANHFDVSECLDQYTRRCPDRTVSFHNFLAYSEFRNELRYNAWLASKGMEILDYCRLRFHPIDTKQ